MKTMLTGLMTAALAATPIITINQTSSKAETKSNLALTSAQNFDISSSASISFQWWNTSDSHTSSTANIIAIDDYATSLADFIAQFPKIQLSLTPGTYHVDITQNYIGYTNPIYPNPHHQGNFNDTPIVLKTANLFKANQSIETTIGSYDYSDSGTAATSTSSIITGLTTIAGKTFLTMACKSSVWGRSGPFSQWEYNVATTHIDKADFLAN